MSGQLIRVSNALVFAAVLILLATWLVTGARAEVEIAWREVGTRLAVGPEAYFVLAGDFNGDNVSDLAVANRGSLKPPTDSRPGNDTISVLLGNANGTFHPRVDYRVGFAPYTIESGDFDEDGVADLAVVCFQSNDDRDVAVLPGRGDGSFADPRFLKVDGDFNYDKNQLADGSPLYASPGLTSLDVADVNADGHEDIIAVAWSSDLIVTFLGDGMGRFLRQQVMRGTPSGPRDVAAHDFDGDGIPDLVLTHYSSDRLTLWRGDGTGRFAKQADYPCGGRTPYHLELADLNNDGKQDIVVGNRGASDDVALFVGKGGFQFACVGSYSAGEPNDPNKVEYEIRDVAVADLDGDGALEVAAACRRANRIVVWRVVQMAGRPALQPAGEYHLPRSGPRAFAVADFDQDGTIELAAALASSRRVVLLKPTRRAPED